MHNSMTHFSIKDFQQAFNLCKPHARFVTLNAYIPTHSHSA